MAILNSLLRSLRGSNLEIFKFGMYLSFPIGWMYYFGTNLDERFKVPDFWPTQAQSHKLPYEKEDIRAEIERMNRNIKERELSRRQETEKAFEGLRAGLKNGTFVAAANGDGAEDVSN